MNVAILHYHLNRGGVTRVIANHLLALDSLAKSEPAAAIRTSGDAHAAAARVALLFGGRDVGWPRELADRLSSVDLSLHPLSALDYDEERPPVDSDRLAAQLQRSLSQIGFQPHDTVLHVHNHSLGKNSALPGALRRMAEFGFRLLLQIHDFAEDFRPQNYRRLSETFGRGQVAAALYPQAPQIHYAVLNRRDLRVLRAAGVPTERLHFLPNPVLSPVAGCSRDAARRKLRERFGVEPSQRYVLYPVRGIRRKNVGEALLWTLLAGGETVTGITLAPVNPAGQTHYNRWRNLAAKLEAPFLFETGEAGGLLFEENLAAADLILTTSLAEGFGMVYLESWLAGRALTGRNLPEITVDFIGAGLKFPALYDRLDVPIGWIGRAQVEDAFRTALSATMQAFDQPPVGSRMAGDVVAQKTIDGWIDFGDLNAPMQQQVVGRIAADRAARREIIDRNPFLHNDPGDDAELIDSNQRLIETAYALEPSGRRLQEVYRSLSAVSAAVELSELPDGPRILSWFLDPARFRLIRG